MNRLDYLTNWDESIKDDTKDYNHVDAAIQHLSFTYDELNDSDLPDMIREHLKEKPVTLTGDHVADYKAIRKRIERLTEEWIMDRRFLS